MSVNDLVTAMNAKSTTAGWDVVVSYSVAKLNGLLKTMWDRQAQSTAKIDEYDDATRRMKYKYDIDIDSPTLEFISSTTALLTFGLNGFAWAFKPDEGFTDKTPKVSISRGQYILKVKVPLASISGKVLESGDVQKLKSEAQKETRVFVDGSNNNSGQHVIFHFHDIAGSDWGVSSTDKTGNINPIVDPAIAAAAGALQQWFLKTIKMMDYTIARVVATQDSKDPTTYLQPKSFVVAANGSGESAALCIYIETVDGSGGERISKPTFNVAASPLPRGYDASIIFRHELFRDKFLINMLGSRFYRCQNALQPNETGFGVDVYIDQSFIKSAGHREYGMGGYMGNTWYDNITEARLDLKYHPVRLRIEDGKATWKLDHTQWCDWDEVLTTDGGGFTRKGKTKVHYTIDKTSSITMAENDIGIFFKLTKDDLNIESTAESYNGDILDKFSNFFDSQPFVAVVPGSLSHLKADFNDAEVKMKVNFFATKNVFAGGGATSDIIDIVVGDGIKTPHDVLIVGQMKSS